ncbi:hypothetical protein O1L60_39230 [Streptomyces diastatochromogenes]|nr:hypothetical protein [Streptomyces diastatochromogenes]MCZ0982930.1 hypothetical protein [Streptomyces diastatochromogenes]
MAYSVGSAMHEDQSVPVATPTTRSPGLGLKPSGAARITTPATSHPASQPSGSGSALIISSSSGATARTAMRISSSAWAVVACCAEMS